MRQLRAWLAAQSIESLATNYVVMTDSSTWDLNNTEPMTIAPRPRIYTAKDLETEIKRRLTAEMGITAPDEREFIIQVAFQDTIDKAKTIYQMLGG